MADPVQLNESTASKRRMYFYAVDLTDGITPETGEAGGQPQISTNGGAFTGTGIGVLVAMGNGQYYADVTQAAVNGAVGDRILGRYKSANTAEAPSLNSLTVTTLDSVAGEANALQVSGSAPAADALETAALAGLALEGADGDTLETLSDQIDGAATVAEIFDRVLNKANHNIANSAGRLIREIKDGYTLSDGTLQAGGTASVTLAASEPTGTVLEGRRIAFIDGTGSGQEAIIYAYDGATKIAKIVPALEVAVDGTTDYAITTALAHVEMEPTSLYSGYLTAAGATSVTLGTDASDQDDFYNGACVVLPHDGLAAGQARIITDYVGSTRVCTLHEAWIVTPAGTEQVAVCSKGHSAGYINTVLENAHGAGAWTSVAGGGAYSVDITTEESDTTPIAGVTVSIYTDAARTALSATVGTGLSGTYEDLGMNAGTYYWAAAKAGTTFTSGAFTIAASGEETLTGTVLSPSAATQPDGCMIFGTLRNTDGQVQEGLVVTFTIEDLPSSVSGNVMAIGDTVSQTTDSNGYFEQELVQGTIVLANSPEARINSRKTVPAAASQDLSTW